MKIGRGIRGLGGAGLAVVALTAPAAQAAPLNDDVEARLPVLLEWADTRSNEGATIEAGERLTANDPGELGCGTDGQPDPEGVPISKTMWWSFVGDGGPVTVSTRGSTIDSVLALYEISTAFLLGCNDDLQPFDPVRPGLSYNIDSEMLIDTVAGREYLVQVGACTPVPPGTCGPDSGTVTVRVSPTPDNDDRSAPQPIEAGAPFISTNTGATLESGELAMCGTSPFAKTVWFRYTAPGPGTAVISASGFDTVMAVYREGSAVALDCNDDAVKGETGGSQVPAAIPAGAPLVLTAGNYLIQVGGYHDPGFSTVAGANGPLSVQVSFTEDLDVDDDGIDRAHDCDDENPTIRPGLPEIPNNEIDENCDGILAFDGDGDGSLAPPAGPDCDDTNPGVHPGAREKRGNKVDEDCDGVAAPLRYLRPFIDLKTFRYGSPDPHTKVKEVIVGAVQRGTRVRLRCGRGCHLRSRPPVVIRQSRGKVVVAHGFRVEPGARLVVRVTKAGWIGRAKIYRFRRDKTYLERQRCIRPNGSLRPCARQSRQ